MMIFSLNTFALLPRFFYIGLVLTFFVNLGLIEVISLYLRKKKWQPAVVFLLLLLAFDTGFYSMAKKRLLMETGTYSAGEQPVMPAFPPARQYDFFKKHKLIRDDKHGNIFAQDPERDDFLICLINKPARMIYDPAFDVVLQKEGKKFKEEKDYLELAQFIIRVYYHDAEPVFFSNKDEMIKFFLSRRDPSLNKIGNLLKSPPQKTDAGKPHNNEKKAPDPYQELLSLTKDVCPPQLKTDWDGGNKITLWTYSLRYRLLNRWTFKINPNGGFESQIQELDITTLPHQ